MRTRVKVGLAVVLVLAGWRACRARGSDGSPWSRVPAPIEAHYHGAWAVFPSGMTVVAGGYAAWARTSRTVEIWTPGHRAWTRAPDLLVPRVGAAAVVLD